MSFTTGFGYAANSKGDSLSRVSFDIPELTEFEIKLAVTHCGICYTDIQGIDDYYGITRFPFFPGHEVIGRIVEIGPSVRDLHIGDRVGIGWQGRSCGQCEWCLKGEEQLCLKIAHAGSWEPHGGFSDVMVADSRFAYPIPQTMPSETAAVMMCAGVTVFSALRTYETTELQRIAIIGMGGLGHLAVQFARHMNYDVTVISGTPEKQEEALAFGAHHFMLSTRAVLEQKEYAFDLLLCTTHGAMNPELFIDTLKKKGRMILVGFPDLCLNSTDLVAHQISITGSFVGNRAVMREMLAFADRNGIKPMIELMPMSQVNKALQRVKENKARYRIVLTNE